MFNTNQYNENLQETVKNIPNIDRLKDKSILITGATGLIGSAIVDTLIWGNLMNKSNIKLYVAGRNKDKMISRFGHLFSEDFLKFVEYDANHELEFKFDVDYILHGASNAHPIAYSQKPVETMLSNFYGMYNLLQYAKDHKVTRTLYISSSEVYGQKENNELYKEKDYGNIDILNARSCYPSSKRAAETLCASFRKQYSLDVVIVRPGHIYGPTMTVDDSRASAQFARNAVNGEDIIMKSPGQQLRSYCYVFDCVSAILTVLLNGKSGEAYNISNKESIVTIRELAESFANTFGGSVVFEKPGEIESSGYNMMSSSALDSSKLESLGWNGLYDVEEGVKRTVEILKSQSEMKTEKLHK